MADNFVVVVLFMPSAQRLLDRLSNSRKTSHKNKEKKKAIHICWDWICNILEALFIQPYKILTAVKCVIYPGCEKCLDKHNEIKVRQ